MEKQQKEVIDHKTIKLPTNWVLVLPDEEMEKYHLNGKETDIYVGKSFMKYIDEYDSLDFEMKETVDTYAQHWPISGTVVTVPDKNVFLGRDLKRFKDSISDEALSPDDMKKMNAMTQASLKVDSKVEVVPGDKVTFDYMMNIKCYDEGLYFQTDIGTLFLIRYDDLIGKHTDGNHIPLNGNIFFEWIQPREKSGLQLLEKEIYEVVGLQEGVITHVGTDPEFYLNGSELNHLRTEFHAGERMYFMPQFCSMIESKLHLTIFDGREIYTVDRQHIYAKVAATG